MNVRLPTTMATSTPNHASTGPKDASRHRRTVVSAPTYSVVSAAQVRPEARTPPHLQAEHLALGHECTDRTAPRDEPRRARDEPGERPQRRERLAEPAGEQSDDQLDDREQDDLQRATEQARAARERGHRPHPVTRTQLLVVEVGAPLLQTLAVAHAGIGCHHDPRTLEVRSPAQLGVVAVERDGRVEPAELAEQVGPHEQARRRQHEHVTNRVVLLLVDLARLDDRVGLAEPVETESHVLQPSRLVPVDQLRTDHAGVRAVQLGHEGADGVRFGRDVVVTQQEEAVVALDQPEDLVGGRPEPGFTPIGAPTPAGWPRGSAR